jgi:hypothetical protein
MGGRAVVRGGRGRGGHRRDYVVHAGQLALRYGRTRVRLRTATRWRLRGTRSTDRRVCRRSGGAGVGVGGGARDWWLSGGSRSDAPVRTLPGRANWRRSRPARPRQRPSVAAAVQRADQCLVRLAPDAQHHGGSPTPARHRPTTRRVCWQAVQSGGLGDCPRRGRCSAPVEPPRAGPLGDGLARLVAQVRQGRQRTQELRGRLGDRPHQQRSPHHGGQRTDAPSVGSLPVLWIEWDTSCAGTRGRVPQCGSCCHWMVRPG